MIHLDPVPASIMMSESQRPTVWQVIPSIPPRHTFLETSGLSHDPFITPVAEEELKSAEPQPYLYSYFCPPPLVPTIEGQTTFQTLRMRRHTFVYGEPGDGKTTLRLALEANCRTVLDHTLVVTYDLGEDIKRPLTWQEHADRLAKALAIDLFVQVAEQFNPLVLTPTSEQVTALQQQFRLGGRHLQRLARQILDQPSPNAQGGLSAYWPTIGKSSIRYVPSSNQLLDLIRQCLTPDPISSSPSNALDALQKGLQAARVWNFSQVVVLVDGVDTRQRATEDMMALIEPLLADLARWESAGVYFKFFLPLDLQAIVAARVQTLHLPAGYFEAKIVWNDDALRELLAQRFRAAGSHYVGFDALAGEDLQGRLDALIIQSAAGSPRRMLRVISSLIDEHVASPQFASRFSAQDWESTRTKAYRIWGDDLPSLSSIQP